jgi:hypothetical protein
LVVTTAALPPGMERHRAKIIERLQVTDERNE